MEMTTRYIIILHGSSGSGLSFRLHLTSDMITIFWLVPSASSIPRWFASWTFLMIKPELYVPPISGTAFVPIFGTAFVILLWLLVTVTPVAKPPKKASYSRYNNNYGKDNKNRPKWPIWMVWRWLLCDSVGINQHWLLLWLRQLLLLWLNRHFCQAWMREEKEEGFGFKLLVLVCSSCCCSLSAHKESFSVYSWNKQLDLACEMGLCIMGCFKFIQYMWGFFVLNWLLKEELSLIKRQLKDILCVLYCGRVGSAVALYHCMERK